MAEPGPSSQLLTTFDISISNYKLVYFDFETTGFSPYYEEIVQIGAVSSNHGDFQSFILPTKQVDFRAAQVTGLCLRNFNDGSTRLVRIQEKTNTMTILETVDLRQAMLRFLDYIRSVSKEGEWVLLTGHNVSKFDMPFLFNSLEKVGLIDQLLEIVNGVVDTLVVFKKIYPKSECGYRQGRLYEKFVGNNASFDEHNAIADVRALQKLIQAASITNDQMLEFGYTDVRDMYTKFVERKRIHTDKQPKLLTCDIVVQGIMSGGQSETDLNATASDDELSEAINAIESSQDSITTSETNDNHGAELTELVTSQEVGGAPEYESSNEDEHVTRKRRKCKQQRILCDGLVEYLINPVTGELEVHKRETTPEASDPIDEEQLRTAQKKRRGKRAGAKTSTKKTKTRKPRARKTKQDLKDETPGEGQESDVEDQVPQISQDTTSWGHSETASDEELSQAVDALESQESQSQGSASTTNEFEASNHKLVYFDFETTGFSPSSDEIIQIGATSDHADFQTFILPSKQVDYRATRKTGLCLRKFSTGSTRLVRVNNKTNKMSVLDTVNLKEAMQAFLKYIGSVSKEGQVFLIGHNVNTFDMPFLFSSLEKVGLVNQIFEIVSGVIDTMVVFKRVYPMSEGGYSQKRLFEKFLGTKESFDEHNAIADVQALKKIVRAASITSDQMMESGYTDIRDMYQRYFAMKSFRLSINCMIKANLPD